MLPGRAFAGAWAMPKFATALTGVSQPFEFRLVRSPVSASPAPEALVFAQPVRRESTEERVVKQFDTREILEKVQLQVQKSLATTSPLQNLKPQDYEEIGEHVYSMLTRRLRVERERLGLG